MLVELRTKVWWSERDLSQLSCRFTNGNRAISVAMSNSPQRQGDDIATYTTDSPTIMLWVVDGGGDVHNVTEGVLGSQTEFSAQKYMAAAMLWLLEAK